jgi:hypothetical protein
LYSRRQDINNYENLDRHCGDDDEEEAVVAIGKGGLPRARRQSRNEFGWCASVGIKRLRNWKKNKWQLTQIFD